MLLQQKTHCSLLKVFVVKTEIQGQTHVALDNVHMRVILAEDQQETDCKAYQQSIPTMVRK